MVGSFQPLTDTLPIANADGTPTQYFIRWAQERQLSIGSAITAEEAEAIVSAFVADYLTTHVLQAGNGIRITPDGNLTNNPTITAYVQEILDQISSTRGTILYRGASTWAALAPGTAGYLLSTGGPGANPSWVAPPTGGGGSLYDLSAGVPALSAFTSFNFTNASSAESAAKAVWISAVTAASGGGIKGLYKPAPTPPYRVAMLLQDAIVGDDSWLACGWRRNDGALHLILQNGPQFAVQAFNSPTSFNSQQFNQATNEVGGTTWFGYYDDGTNVFFQRSEDSVNFVTLYTVAKSSSFLGTTGFNNLFFAVRQNNGCNSLLTCRCWDENGLSRVFP